MAYRRAALVATSVGSTNGSRARSVRTPTWPCDCSTTAGSSTGGTRRTVHPVRPVVVVDQRPRPGGQRRRRADDRRRTAETGTSVRARRAAAAPAHLAITGGHPRRRGMRGRPDGRARPSRRVGLAAAGTARVRRRPDHTGPADRPRDRDDDRDQRPHPAGRLLALAARHRQGPRGPAMAATPQGGALRPRRHPDPRRALQRRPGARPTACPAPRSAYGPPAHRPAGRHGHQPVRHRPRNDHRRRRRRRQRQGRRTGRTVRHRAGLPARAPRTAAVAGNRRPAWCWRPPPRSASTRASAW